MTNTDTNTDTKVEELTEKIFISVVTGATSIDEFTDEELQAHVTDVRVQCNRMAKGYFEVLV